MTRESLPEEYLSIPVFREHNRLAEMDALFDALSDSMLKIAVVLSIHRFSDQQMNFFCQPGSVDFRQSSISLHKIESLDCELSKLTETGRVEFLNDQLDALKTHCQFIADYGFPDMLSVDLELKQNECLSLSQFLRDIVQQSSACFHSVSYDFLNLYFRWLAHRNRVLSYVVQLEVSAKSYALLVSEERYLRLNGMLTMTALYPNFVELERDQDRLRMISQLLYDDTRMSKYHVQMISAKLLCQVEQSTMLKLMTGCQFSSLLLLLLSDTISSRVRNDTQNLLSKRLRSEGFPLLTKVDYYHSFVEIVMTHARSFCIESTLLVMCHEVDYDYHFLYKNDAQRHLLEPIQSLLNCLHEYSLYTALKGDARVSVCEKLGQRVHLLLSAFSSCSFELIAHKLRLLLTLDQRLQSFMSRSSEVRFRFFATALSESSYDLALYQRCVQAIWHAPMEIDFCKYLYMNMHVADGDSLLPNDYLHGFMDLLTRSCRPMDSSVTRLAI